MFKKIAGLLLIITLVAGTLAVPVCADFEQGEKGTFFGITYRNSSRYPNIINPIYLNMSLINENGMSTVIKNIKAELDKLPEGRRCLNITHLTTTIFDDRRNVVYLDAGVEKTLPLIEELFGGLKEAGAKIDYIYDDMEMGLTVYDFENTAIAEYRSVDESIVDSIAKNGALYEEYIKNMLLGVQNDEKYLTDIKPLLEKAGFIFSTNYDLEYVNLFPTAQEPRKTKFYESNPPAGAELSYQIFNDVMTQVVDNAYNKAIFEPIQKNYPEVKFSNYGRILTTGEIPRCDYNGNRAVTSGNLTNKTIGTHTSYVNYGKYQNVRNNPPYGYPYEIYHQTAFNTMLMEIMWHQDSLVAEKKAGYGNMPWVASKHWSAIDIDTPNEGKYDNYGNTYYYEENLYHVLLMGADPLLVFDHSNQQDADNKIISDLLYEVDLLCGFSDREPIVPTVNEVAKWDQRYIITGMNAGGKAVWRVTPDLYVPGVSMENFVFDTAPLTFRVGNQFVEFPEGSYIHTPDKTSGEYGYWVIAPEGTKPVQYRDDSFPEPDEPVETFDFIPTGSKLEVTGNGKKSPVEAIYIEESSSESSQENNEEKPVEIKPMITLKIKPLSFKGKNIPLVTATLPDDIKGHWAEGTMANMFAMGIISGTGEGLEPNATLTKSQYITMLFRAFGVESQKYEGGLLDVNEDSWYADAIYTAVAGGLIEADNGIAEPDAPLTREKMVEITVKLIEDELKYDENLKISFSDEYRISKGCAEYVKKAVAAGLIKGYSDGEFKPKNILTRAEAAKVLEAYFNN